MVKAMQPTIRLTANIKIGIILIFTLLILEDTFRKLARQSCNNHMRVLRQLVAEMSQKAFSL